MTSTFGHQAHQYPTLASHRPACRAGNEADFRQLLLLFHRYSSYELKYPIISQWECYYFGLLRVAAELNLPLYKLTVSFAPALQVGLRAQGVCSHPGSNETFTSAITFILIERSNTKLLSHPAL